MTTKARQDRLLALLLRDAEWSTAASLADALGVTPRSIRSYVTAVNARVPGGAAIESGPLGYRAGADAALALRAGSPADSGTPRDRLHTLVRRLLDAADGIDVYETADSLHVSAATLEADLARVRGLLGGTELTLERSASTARLRGTEVAQRRLLSKLAHDEMDAGMFDLDALRRTLGERSVGARAFGPFKAELVAELGALGYFVNEIGIGDVVMHIAIAADRVTRDRGLEAAAGESSDAVDAVADLLDRLTLKHIGVQLGAGDLRHLATLVLTRIVAPGAPAADDVRSRLDPAVEGAVRAVVEEAASQYLVDIAHDDFVLRLALHVQNLLHRSREQAWSRNPLTRSLKSTYPMIFEVAVYIAKGLQDALGIPILDDEIAYIAMHVGGRRTQPSLRSVAHRDDRVPRVLRAARTPALERRPLTGPGDRGRGRRDAHRPAWDSIDTDLVLTTIDPPRPGDRFVRISRSSPTPTSSACRPPRRGSAAGGGRAAAGRTRDDLSPDAFVRGLDAADGEAGVIRRLGGCWWTRA